MNRAHAQTNKRRNSSTGISPHDCDARKHHHAKDLSRQLPLRRSDHRNGYRFRAGHRALQLLDLYQDPAVGRDRQAGSVSLDQWRGRSQRLSIRLRTACITRSASIAACGRSAKGHLDVLGGDFYSIAVACLDDVVPVELIDAPLHFSDGRNNNWQKRSRRNAASLIGFTQRYFMNPTITFITHPTVVPVARLRCSRNSVPITSCNCSISRRGEQRQSTYRAINPMGKVPAIRHGDALITEQPAVFSIWPISFRRQVLPRPSAIHCVARIRVGWFITDRRSNRPSSIDR